MELLQNGLKEWRATAAVCQNSGKKWVLDVCARLFCGFRHDMFEFRDRFDILLEKRLSGAAELRRMMVYGKSQLKGESYAGKNGYMG